MVKAKKLISLLLSFVMILGLMVTPTFAQDTNTITAFVNVTKYGEVLKDKSDKAMALVEIELSGKDYYTLDDVFKTLHDNCYNGGSEEGYASLEGKYGLCITKFWGDDSGNYCYQVNGGTEAVLGISHQAEDGDYIDIAINENLYPDTENYTKFDKYKSEIYTGEQIELTLDKASYDENGNMTFSPCEGAVITIDGEETEISTNSEGKVILSFDSVGEHIVSAIKTKEVGQQTVTAIAAPICVITVKDLPDACINVVSDAELFVGEKGKKHFVSFTEIEPVYIVADEENTKYYFELADNSTYNYRVSGENYVTYGGTFKKTADFSLDISEAQLMPDEKTKNTVDRDTTSNNAHNVADIYLNINPQGFLKLSQGETFQIVALRNWEAVNNTSANYFIEPDFHYEVTDENGNTSDVVKISDSGLLTAQKSGTAIVYVTYDAMTLNFGTSDEFYGAIHPENTGVFVVSVDGEGSGIQTGMTINEGKNPSSIKLSGDNIDSEHDCIYFLGEQGEYTFTPETEGVNVSVANPTVNGKTRYSGFAELSSNDDNSFSVPLKVGRNIVKLEKDGKEEYQIITAKKVDVTINNGEDVHAGDNVSIVFDKLYHPANKLAGVYNMNAIVVYTDVSGYEGQLIGSTSAQYNFADSSLAQAVANVLKEKNVWGVINYEKSSDLIVPADYPYDTFVLLGGSIYTSGWGDSYGNHRAITYENGKGANLNADAKLGYFGKLPDIEIPIVASASALSSITLNTDNVKTEYFVGDEFDSKDLVVTANYEDGATQIATNYTVSPEILTSDTQNVVVTYRGKTAEIPVVVKEPKITSIEITTPPSNTQYKEGETFTPSGMVVMAVYENGEKRETIEYSYSPNRALETSDTEMIISYIGENAVDNIESVSQPITVAEKSSDDGSATTSSTITVYFTLLGDDKHGTPSGSDDTHTKTKGNLDTWIPKTKITLDKGSYVIDAVKKALSLEGIPYTCDNNYISEIKGLSEFDNGNLSGWMYTVNGKYPTQGINEKKLSNRDSIIFHYTDDYTLEKTDYSTKGSSSSSKSDKDSSIKEENSQENTENTKTEDTKSEEVITDDTKENIETLEMTKPVFDEKTYTDVKTDDWYYDSVKYAYDNNLMQGTGEGFEPENEMSRAMLVTVLYRLCGEPKIDKNNEFRDVGLTDWYFDSVSWAKNTGIVSGTDNGGFSPSDSVTREQMATILFRYATFMGYDVEVKGDISSFKDNADVSAWAKEAMSWASAKGLIQGVGNSMLSPKGTATRAQVATIFMRFSEMKK